MAEVPQQLRPRGLQQRPHHVGRAEPPAGGNAGQHFPGRPPQEPHGHGFHLIILGVRRRDPARPHRSSHPREEFVPGLPAGVFQRSLLLRGPRSHVHFLHRHRNPQVHGHLPDEFSVGAGFRSQAVVEVRDVQRERVLVLQTSQQVQEGDRVCTAGDRDDHGVARAQQVELLDCVAHLLVQVAHRKQKRRRPSPFPRSSHLWRCHEPERGEWFMVAAGRLELPTPRV